MEPAIPYKALAENPNCILVTTPGGGHLGWAAGGGGPFGESSYNDKTLRNLRSQGRVPVRMPSTLVFLLCCCTIQGLVKALRATSHVVCAVQVGPGLTA